ncbi:MAG: SH3 domain-containing protein [Deltaproteobacteria bacterium]|nr:SH3 domain-containing protein [Deltaproteobacteria bacterium]
MEREERLNQHAHTDHAATADTDTAQQPLATKFSGAGPLPPVSMHTETRGPSPSDRAFGAGSHVRVTANGLNVRTSPQIADGNIVGGLHHGEHAEVIGSEGGWVNVKHRGLTGYVSGEWIEPVQAEKAAPQAEQAAAPKTDHAAAPKADHAAAPEAEQAAAPKADHEHKPAGAAPQVTAETEAPNEAALEGQLDAVVRAFDAGTLDQEQAIAKFQAYDKAHHGGASSMQALAMMPTLISTLVDHGVQQAHHKAQQQQVAPAPTPAPAAPATAAPAAPAAEHADKAADKSGSADKAAFAPIAGAKLEDPALLALAGKVHDSHMDALLPTLASVLSLDADLRKTRDQSTYFEVKGANREKLVAGIGALRGQLAQLNQADPAAAAFVVAVNHKLEAVAPYHFQLNIKSVESVGGWSTCNFTSLAMALETIGIGAANYKAEKHPAMLAVAGVFYKDIGQARLASNGHDAAKMSSLQGLRLPDFMQLAAVVHALGGTEPTHDNIIAAANQVVGDKKFMSKVVGVVADFGASASTVSVKWDDDRKTNAKTNEALSAYGDKHRGDHKNDQKVEAENTERNAAERATDAKSRDAHQKRADHLAEQQHDALVGDEAINRQLPIDNYKAAVTRDLGKHLDAGHGILAGLSNHWTKLYAIEEHGIRVQDPGQYDRSEMSITWEEARAMGYFWTNWVIQ